MDVEGIKTYLKNYAGPRIRIMEVCGSHTAAIEKNGIRGLLSDQISLISGPGCPVCVTPSAYIDHLLELAEDPKTCIVTFGDLIRVPGSQKSLGMARAEGARVEMVYSPMDMLALAEREPETRFVFAAIGFETTTPVYALLVQQILEKGIRNVRLLASLKRMPPVIRYLCDHDAPVEGFLAPGHVCVVTGSRAFEPLAESYGIPFGVSGFEPEEILLALYGIVKVWEESFRRGEAGKAFRGRVMNFYPSVVSEEGNVTAQKLVDTYFTSADACWRGMGVIEDSGLLLREEYAWLDAGSAGLVEDKKKNAACRCDEVLMGKRQPRECPLFGKVCTPLTPQGACMVSTEGSCFSFFANR